MNKIVRFVSKNFHVVLPLFTVFLFLIVIVLYFIPINKTAIESFVEYLSGWSSIVLFLITTLYVIFTGKQIVELKNQRQHQFQALPDIELKYITYTTPEIHINPKNGEVVLINDIDIYINMKNIGNSTALFVDYFGCFIKDKNKFIPKKDKSKSARTNALKADDERKFCYSLRDEECNFISELNKGSDGSCPIEEKMGFVFKSNCLYRNIEGLSYLITFYSSLVFDHTDQKKISDWLVSINSFNNTYNLEISRIKATHQRKREEAYPLIEELEEKYYKALPRDLIIIAPMLIRQSYNIKEISQDDYNSISRKLVHGFPIGTSLAKYKDEIEKLIKKQKNINKNG